MYPGSFSSTVFISSASSKKIFCLLNSCLHATFSIHVSFMYSGSPVAFIKSTTLSPFLITCTFFTFSRNSFMYPGSFSSTVFIKSYALSSLIPSACIFSTFPRHSFMYSESPTAFISSTALSPQISSVCIFSTFSRHSFIYSGSPTVFIKSTTLSPLIPSACIFSMFSKHSFMYSGSPTVFIKSIALSP